MQYVNRLLITGLKLSEMDFMYGIIKYSFLEADSGLPWKTVLLKMVRNCLLACIAILDLIVLKMNGSG